jgi:hypothetical protein
MFTEHRHTRCPPEPGKDEQHGHRGSRHQEITGVTLTGLLTTRTEGRGHARARKGERQQHDDRAYGETVMKAVPP